MGEIGRRRPGDGIDLTSDRGEAILDADDDALDLLGAFAGTLGPKRRVTALTDEVADLAIKIADGVANQVGSLPCCFRENS